MSDKYLILFKNKNMPVGYGPVSGGLRSGKWWATVR